MISKNMGKLELDVVKLHENIMDSFETKNSDPTDVDLMDGDDWIDELFVVARICASTRLA